MEYNDHLKKRAKIYKIYQRRRTQAKAKGEDLSSSEDEEGNKKTGYELTPYMIEYNANTAMDFTQGYDPKSLDDNFKISSLYDKQKSEMPTTVDFDFEIKYSGIELSKETLHFLEDCFEKYSSVNTTIIYPNDMLNTFKKHGIDKTNPSIYSMMKWISDANTFSGTDGMTFDEVIQYAAFFFSQRHSEEGLKYVFELFDPERKGFLLRE